MTSHKADLRHSFLEKRAAIASVAHIAWSGECCSHLTQTIRTLSPPPAIIAGYHPMRGELDAMPALLALGLSFTIALPVTHDTTLHFCRWSPGEPLAKGRFGIAEPVQPHDLVAPDIILVPLVAFDRRGHRLGYGRGYYDRLLDKTRAQGKAVLAVGMAFSLQESPALPDEDHDHRLDMVITEEDVIKIV